jgi:hypothetical protein
MWPAGRILGGAALDGGELSASRFGHFTPEKWNLIIHWIGSLLDP